VQLVVLGFSKPDFRGEILAELERLRESDTVRVIDSLTVYKDAEGDVAVLKVSNLSDEESAEFGALVGALVGLGAGGEEGMETGAELGAEAAAEGGDVFPEEEAWDVLDELPTDSAAALILLEHRWAIPYARRHHPRWRLPNQQRSDQSARPRRRRASVGRGGSSPARIRPDKGA